MVEERVIWIELGLIRWEGGLLVFNRFLRGKENLEESKRFTPARPSKGRLGATADFYHIN